MPEDDMADLGAAKALANPLRQRILRELELLGEATSTTLAARLGVTTGGTSYNLRILAEHGFVEEVPERARGKERWWRSARRSVRFEPRGAQEPAMRDAVDLLAEVWFGEDKELLARLDEVRDQLGPWAAARPFSRGVITVDLDELMAFFTDYLALLKRYQRPHGQAAPGARTVHTRFVAFPDPEEGATGRHD
ncbi:MULTISPECIES: ArsR/SmtB family transcription factor [Nonomuraea]|uniref:ArsR/SmtB family transcription factor n=1 Tax=Nonomuraea salmonea TaxID=46181 RepID=A0ABV5P1K4_9ACTN